MKRPAPPTAAKPPTRGQLAALERVSAGLSPWRGMRARAGGAISRMVKKMIADGLLEWATGTDAPLRLTAAGLAALRKRNSRWA